MSDQARMERITKARQAVLDKIEEQQKRIYGAQETISRYQTELAGFDACLHAMNEPDMAEKAPQGTVRGTHQGTNAYREHREDTRGYDRDDANG